MTDNAKNNKIKYTREYLQNENNQFTQRINLFFLAESMLFISYVTSLNINNISLLIPFLLIFVGTATTVFIMFVLWRQAECIQNTKNRLREIDNFYDEIINLRKEQKGAANIVVSQLLPGIFLSYQVRKEAYLSLEF